MLKQPRGSLLRALLEAAWSLWESGYLWHLKAALIEDLSFVFFSRHFSLSPNPTGLGQQEVSKDREGMGTHSPPALTGDSGFLVAGGAMGVRARAEPG